MKRSVEIFEKFDFLTFSFDPMALCIRIEGSHKSEGLLGVRAMLAPYSLASKHDVLDLIRSKQFEGNLLLTHKENLAGFINITEVRWKFESESGLIIGLCQERAQPYLSARNSAHLENLTTPPDAVAWKDLTKPNTKNGIPLGPKPYAPPAISSARERLVQLNVALEGAKLGFWDWNRRNNLLAINDQWARMLGLSIRDIRNVDQFFERLHPDDKKEVEKELTRYSQGRTRLYRAKFRLRHLDGHYVPIEAVGAFQLRTLASNEKEMHMVGIHRDCSKEDQRERVLTEMIERANQQMEAKSIFLANVSHEMRTPLHGMMNLMQMAKNHTQPDSVQANYLDAGIQAARALGFKLDGLVDFASLDSAPLLAKPTKGRLAPLIALTKSYCGNSIDQKGLSFELEQAPDTLGHYYFDEKLMAQVMLGLVDNAVKFTESGKVGIRVELLKRSTRPDQPDSFIDKLQFQFIDTGIGMSQEQINKVFLPYQQTKTKRNRAETGIGVGLSLVHACIDALGGEVEVESEPGFGTSITVTLHLEGYCDNYPTKSAKDIQLKAPIKRALVVDDVSLNRMILRNDLESRGIEVQEAENGQSVLALFADPAFETDVVLMDIQMPVMDGITATKKLRQELKVTLPIIGITADATRDTEQDGLQAGMNGVLFKPIDVAALVGKLTHQPNQIAQ